MRHLFILLLISTFLYSQKSYTKEKITSTEFHQFSNSSFKVNKDSVLTEDHYYSVAYGRNKSRFRIFNPSDKDYKYLQFKYVGSHFNTNSHVFFTYGKEKGVLLLFSDIPLEVQLEHIPAISPNGKYVAIYTRLNTHSKKVRKNGFTVVEIGEDMNTVFAIASKKWTPFEITFDDQNHVLIKIQSKRKSYKPNQFDYYRYRIAKMENQ